MLGRLIFEQGIKPSQLEDLMRDLPHLRFVEVLVKCCCPQIPSSTTITHRAIVGPPSFAILSLNEGEVSSEVTDPCSFSNKLLTKLMVTLKDSLALPQIQDGVLGPEELVHAYNSSEMKKLIAKTPLLAGIDLAALDTPAKQMTFYSNVANFLYAHALMVYLACEAEGSQLSTLSGSGVTMATMQSNRLVQAAYFTKVGYYIGQLGLVRLV